MKSRKFMFGILAITLVFAMAIVGCDDSSDVDSSLNGTWETIDSKITYIFNNGNFEMQYDDPYIKGIYKTSGDKLTITVTHYCLYNDLTGELKWYSKNEAKIAFADSYYDELYNSFTITYNIKDKTLTLYFEDGATVLTKK